MIQVNKQVDYALQFVLALTRQEKEKPLSLRRFSTESTISFLFLQKIAKALREAGIVRANKGPHGGYFLLASPKTLTLRAVVEAVEGPYAAFPCMKEGFHCIKEETCISKNAFTLVQTRMVEELDRITIEDLALTVK
ncbi:MAG: Rrf2 family transcriptional regulator [Candidatus Magasanikbacteria bacterium]|jgi:Rrf2 family protein|nr:Rrf2 family transcriptional regulator [Candidatus Magasanikbacteria bacterium]MBT4221348.1 Rrf2 family transcriptional regulator [Candidatus Magasanikbacteria bacterium]MBT4350804.1 Rrf2 family transcriptional regulator [Candidatus Magasanikbacteria bacterium]MBT4541520.1 Rrf2 family transcriptional regulator [Candidatus Magasanikbacteria bacterium]MBT6253472.1 Rrf2 family transcriptional regulator [Candidatus Magasanikbacteria bacterium]